MRSLKQCRQVQRSSLYSVLRQAGGQVMAAGMMHRVLDRAQRQVHGQQLHHPFMCSTLDTTCTAATQPQASHEDQGVVQRYRQVNVPKVSRTLVAGQPARGTPAGSKQAAARQRQQQRGDSAGGTRAAGASCGLCTSRRSNARRHRMPLPPASIPRCCCYWLPLPSTAAATLALPPLTATWGPWVQRPGHTGRP